MANATTVTKTGNFISLLFEDEGVNYLYSTDTTGNPGGNAAANIVSIMWHPDADGDVLLIREGSSSGAILFQDEGAGEAESRIKYYGGRKGTRMNISITASQCNDLGAGIVIFELA